MPLPKPGAPLRTAALAIVCAAATILLSIIAADWWVCRNAQGKLYTSTGNIPGNRVGLLPGTSRQLADGSPNWYYKHRIEAAASLYKAGKIEFVLASGDNSRKNYDEPSSMKADLVAQGVPESKIFLDYAGFRTLDSVIRAKEIFGLQKFTLISQPFHNERAIFIAESYGLNAIGFNAADLAGAAGAKVQLREKLARVKMMLDLMLGKQPKFMGEKITIE